MHKVYRSTSVNNIQTHRRFIPVSMLLGAHVFVTEMQAAMEAVCVVDITVLDPFCGRSPFD